MFRRLTTAFSLILVFMLLVSGLPLGQHEAMAFEKPAWAEKFDNPTKGASEFEKLTIGSADPEELTREVAKFETLVTNSTQFNALGKFSGGTNYSEDPMVAGASLSATSITTGSGSSGSWSWSSDGGQTNYYQDIMINNGVISGGTTGSQSTFTIIRGGSSQTSTCEVWTADANKNSKTEFGPGESVYVWVSVDRPVTIDLIADIYYDTGGHEQNYLRQGKRLDAAGQYHNVWTAGDPGRRVLTLKVRDDAGGYAEATWTFYVRTGGGGGGGSPELRVDVWTDKGGQGLNVRDGSYQVGEEVTIYYSANKECTAKLTINKPDGSQLVYGPNDIPAGTRSKVFTAAEPLGEREVVFEARAGSEYKKDTCYIEVVGKEKRGPAQLTVLNSPIESGGALQYSFSGFQPNAPVRVYVGNGGVTNTADASGSGQSSFIMNGSPGTYTLVAEDDYGHKATASFSVGSGGGGGQAQLTVLNSPIESGGALQYSFSGFQPNAPVRVYVGNVGVTKTADASGSCQSSFPDNDPPGTYTLVAEDDYGHRATDSFSVGSGGGGGPAKLTVLNSPIQSGGELKYSFSGFQPNAPVRVYVQGGGGVTKTADASGSCQSSFPDNDPPGTYTLVAEDDYGHKATASFEIAPPTKSYYTLTIDTTGEGDTDPSPGVHKYEEGARVTVTASPSSGWKFDQWVGHDSGTNPSITITMDSDKRVTALFVEVPKEEYALSVSIEPSGSGRVSLSPSGGIYAEGTEVTLTAEPNSGWEFARWGGNAGGGAISKTITMDSDKSVTAYFVKSTNTNHLLSVSASPSDGGTVSPSAGAYADGRQITLTANPNPGWEFDKWGGNDASGTNRSIIITMDSDKSVTAFFVKAKPSKPPVSAAQITSLTVDKPGGNPTYSPGETVTMTCRFKNTGTTDLHLIVVLDIADENNQIVWDTHVSSKNQEGKVIDHKVSLSAGQEDFVSFKWEIPANAKGQYQVQASLRDPDNREKDPYDYRWGRDKPGANFQIGHRDNTYGPYTLKPEDGESDFDIEGTVTYEQQNSSVKVSIKVDEVSAPSKTESSAWNVTPAGYKYKYEFELMEVGSHFGIISYENRIDQWTLNVGGYSCGMTAPDLLTYYLNPGNCEKGFSPKDGCKYYVRVRGLKQGGMSPWAADRESRWYRHDPVEIMK